MLYFVSLYMMFQIILCIALCHKEASAAELNEKNEDSSLYSSHSDNGAERYKMFDDNPNPNYLMSEHDFDLIRAYNRGHANNLNNDRNTNENHRNTRSTTEKENIKPINKPQLRKVYGTFLNIFIISVIGIFFLLIIFLLCLGSKSCMKRFLSGRQRLKKALQYRPSKYSARITPTPENTDAVMGTPVPGIFQIA